MTHISTSLFTPFDTLFQGLFPLFFRFRNFFTGGKSDFFLAGRRKATHKKTRFLQVAVSHLSQDQISDYRAAGADLAAVFDSSLAGVDSLAPFFLDDFFSVSCC